MGSVQDDHYHTTGLNLAESNKGKTQPEAKNIHF